MGSFEMLYWRTENITLTDRMKKKWHKDSRERGISCKQ